MEQNYQAYEGRTFQLAGPAEYSYKELVEFVSDLTMNDTTLVDVPVSVAQKVCPSYLPSCYVS
jgi:hypothetical protein